MCAGYSTLRGVFFALAIDRSGRWEVGRKERLFTAFEGEGTAADY
jgi:hypothetical protein